MKSRFLSIFFAVAAMMVCLSVNADDIFECKFLPGRWNAADFIAVKSARWPNINAFRQEANCIVNTCPADATAEEMLSVRAPETYAAMIYRNPIKGNCEVKVDMSFDYRMAPAIVIAEKPAADANGYPEFRTHYEIVLYDNGINVWRHWFENGKQVWRKVAYLKTKFLPNVKYEMEVDINFTARGPMMEVSVNDRAVGFIDDQIPQEYYVGIIASEGVNRFYEFEIER